MHLKKKERLIEEACRKVEGEHWEMVALLLEKNEVKVLLLKVNVKPLD